MPTPGPLELVIILVIALLILGPGKLPDVGSALGKSIREFRKASSDVQDAVTVKVDTSPLPADEAGKSAPTTASAPTTVVAPTMASGSITASAPTTVAAPTAADLPDAPTVATTPSSTSTPSSEPTPGRN